MKKALSAMLLLALLPLTVRALDYDCAAGIHKYAVVKTIAPTADKDGETQYKCELCGFEYIKILYATSHVWSEWVVDIVPGCAEDGHRYRICTVGTEHKQEESIPAAGHDYSVEIIEPSCLEVGMKIYTCKYCGDVYKEINGQAHGHFYKEEITAEPTEFDEGIKAFTCEYCGDSYTEPVPTLDHTHNYEIRAEQEPGCETNGETVYECKICGYQYTETQKPLGHSYGEWVTVKRPNLTEEGLRRKVCANDSSHIIEETLPKAITFELTPVTVAASGINFGMIAFFIVSILSDIYVIRWDMKKRKELKEKLREQRRRERERRKLEGFGL